jgi:hypothetical protein
MSPIVAEQTRVYVSLRRISAKLYKTINAMDAVDRFYS